MKTNMHKVTLIVNPHANSDANISDANINATLLRAATSTVNNATVVEKMGMADNNATATFTIHLTMVDEVQMQDINNTHRQVNKPTDVLTFPLFDAQEVTTIHQLIQSTVNASNTSNTSNTVNTSNTTIPLGDIIICTPVALRQSITLGHSVTKEVAFLLIHGTLHLLGFDHIQDCDSNVMLPLQSGILDSLQLP